MYHDVDKIVTAAMDLIDEVFDVEDPHLMLRLLMHRMTVQPDNMAQLVMCLAIWASAVPRSGLYETANEVAVERARNRLKAGIGDIDEYLALVQEVRAS